MPYKLFHTLTTYFIGLIWLVNGLVCKVLNYVPRHQEIVGSILGKVYAREFTFMIGLSEILMAIWVFSKYKSKLNAILQILIILLMNSLEFMLVPDLLLWGHWNAFFALSFCFIIYFNEFQLSKKLINA